jgi:Cys-rich protein (TIGR01571 family)
MLQTSEQGKKRCDMNVNGVCAVCNPLIPWVIGRYIADLAAFIVGVAYLARRRTLLRRKFGIAGSSFRDFCLYFWCPKCAICQVRLSHLVALFESLLSAGGIWSCYESCASRT